MQDCPKARTWYAVKAAIAIVPWVTSMYVFYWLHSSGTWTTETAHRGKISVAILGSGIILSFLIWSHFAKREQQ
jgi:hypothetical protein